MKNKDRNAEAKMSCLKKKKNVDHASEKEHSFFIFCCKG